MAALTENRSTLERAGAERSGSLAAAVTAHAGAILMRNAAGFLTPGATATGSVGVGRCEKRADIAAGSAGDIDAEYLPGTFRFENSSGGDAITRAEIGDLCFIVDDQTCARPPPACSTT